MNAFITNSVTYCTPCENLANILISDPSPDINIASENDSGVINYPNFVSHIANFMLAQPVEEGLQEATVEEGLQEATVEEGLQEATVEEGLQEATDPITEYLQFDYQRFFANYRNVMGICSDKEEHIISFSINYVQQNIPSTILSKTEAELDDLDTPILKFLTNLIEIDHQDENLMLQLQVAVATYNEACLNDILDDSQKVIDLFNTKLTNLIDRLTDNFPE